eukprot:CAMPEP_0206803866 /NCGR_PEP_ID=MMETSP0975-20121206/3433_1 /ASSEMBLY_ACC=CAM_ASM_000399 /TAXON_ID=483370 /ORGANISM="non described non described, Strain CCMP2097" /LENGTH=206 /DNA_ID=CAMNT_0054345911 /DNA_START=99 /DNA_END=716 /DNA_ORIENTATION=+
MKSVVLALALAPAAAFSPVQAPQAAAKTSLSAAPLPEGSTLPMGFWDPMGLSEYGSSKTQAWFKAAERKHSRVAMAATIGWAITEAGVRFPGAYDLQGHTFASVPGGLDAEAVFRENGGMTQILFTAGLFELLGESQKPHYMMGGVPGKVPYLWDPVGFTAALPVEEKKRKLDMELNNGRLAMIGFASFWSATYIDGSVPSLPNSW